MESHRGVEKSSLKALRNSFRLQFNMTPISLTSGYSGASSCRGTGVFESESLKIRRSWSSVGCLSGVDYRVAFSLCLSVQMDYPGRGRRVRLSVQNLPRRGESPCCGVMQHVNTIADIMQSTCRGE